MWWSAKLLQVHGETATAQCSLSGVVGPASVPGVRYHVKPPGESAQHIRACARTTTLVLHKEPAPQRIQPEVAETRALQLHGEKSYSDDAYLVFVLPQEVTNGDRRIGSSPSTGSGSPCLRRPDNECYSVQVQR